LLAADNHTVEELPALVMRASERARELSFH